MSESASDLAPRQTISTNTKTIVGARTESWQSAAKSR